MVSSSSDIAEHLPERRTFLSVGDGRGDGEFRVVQDGVAAISGALVELLDPATACFDEHILLPLGHCIGGLLQRGGVQVHQFLAGFLGQAVLAQDASEGFDLFRRGAQALRQAEVGIDRGDRFCGDLGLDWSGFNDWLRSALYRRNGGDVGDWFGLYDRFRGD